MAQVAWSLSPSVSRGGGFGWWDELCQSWSHMYPLVPSGEQHPPNVVYLNVFPKHFPKLNLIKRAIMEICFQVNSEYSMSWCVLDLEEIKAIKRTTHRIVLNGLENTILPLSGADVYHYFSSFGHWRVLQGPKGFTQ